MINLIVYIIAGLGAGIGTGLAGLSAAAVISPMLVTFLHFNAYDAIGIALASDVLASAVSAYTYKKNGNLDVRGSLVMLFTVVAVTVFGSYIASFLPDSTMGSFAVYTTTLLGIKFLIRPVMNTKQGSESKSRRRKLLQSVAAGAVIGFICGFVGAGGGMMMLLILTSVLGYDLKTAVGTSVFIMSFTALTGAVSHFAISDGIADISAFVCCIIFTLVGARISAVFANKADTVTLNRVTGAVLTVLGAAMIAVKHLP
ncbi:MAG: sulfite exporter TauE/SafE family protein [Ruminococcus sp.]|nr:sulfite exporter TauE/SafE family protein [Ruminococcus sp.]